MSEFTNPAHKTRSFWPCFHEVARGCESALEIGCAEGNNLRALGPLVSRKIGVELHREYVRQGDGIEFHVGDCRTILPGFESKMVDLVLLIDVVEHLEKKDGWWLLSEAERLARRKILVWTPQGKMLQDSKHYDPTDRKWMPGLEHRSGWEKQDLESIGYDAATWPDYHRDYLTNKLTIPAMFAVKELRQ